MKTWVGRLAASIVVVLIVYAWIHGRQSPVPAAAENSVHARNASDSSPVGTTRPLLHKTFNLSGMVDVPFEVPPHASTPQLKGTYRSYLAQGGVQPASQTTTDDGEVEFMVLSEQQHADLLAGRPSDALFSADAASNGEVDFTLPPTFGQTTKYFLVFRNATAANKKVVQADFRIDF